MPWTPTNAHDHKKGLSKEQARKWAATANAVLRECKEMNGGDCEGRAIRIANASAGRKPKK